jgi:hypothetical protein
MQQQRVAVIAHFVGATPGSTDIRHTLKRLCSELLKYMPSPLSDSVIPEQYQELSVG